MDLLNYDTRKYFVFWIRIFFGIWLLYAGLYKWIGMGPNVLVGYITTEFDKTWSPHALNVFLAWVILFAEPLLALWILSGIKQRLSWTLTSIFMFQLVAGQSLLMKPDVIYNWMYLVLTVACAALSEPLQRRAD
jgi:uncharacterized membrane protein YphA (DoxX/SURF4 family)